MQISTIATLDTEGVIDEGKATLALSGELSEWLFASKFWANFNLRNGTMFHQFEEDEADASIAQAIARALEQKIYELDDSDEIKFIYRRTQRGEQLYIHTDAHSLISEIRSTIKFLDDSSKEGNKLLLSL